MDTSKSSGSKWLLGILAVLNIIAAIYCFFNPIATDLIIPIVLGVVFLVDGLFTCYAYFFKTDKANRSGWTLALAIILIIGGILVLTRDLFGLFAISFFTAYVTAVVLIATGIIRIVSSFEVKKAGISSWWTILVLGILQIVVGIMLFMYPLSLAYYAGAGLLAEGITQILALFAF